MATKSIVFVITRMRRGGAQRVISILANHYAKKGWDVSIVALLEGGCGYSLLPQVQVIDASIPGKGRNAQVFHWLRWIRGYVKANRPTFVVSFIARVNILTILACCGCKQRIVVSERNDPLEDGRGKITLVASKLLYRYADRVIFQTKYQQRCYGRRTERNGVIVPNPLETFRLPAGEPQNEIVNVGKLLPDKAQALLIDAFALFAQAHPDYSLAIYGEGSERANLEAQIERLGLRGKVRLLGNVTDVVERISHTACFILCSRFEGMSNALNEALSIGLPCVVTPYHGVEDVITDHNNGLVADYTSESLCSAMRAVVEQPALSEQLRRNAILSAQKYRLPVVIDQWEAAIEG